MSAATVGSVVGAVVGSVVPGAGTAAGATAGGFLGSMFGGRKECPQQATEDATAFMLSRLTTDERRELGRLFAAANKGRAMPTVPQEIAFAAVGGKDCKVSSAEGREFQAEFNRLLTLYAAPVAYTAPASATAAPDPFGPVASRNSTPAPGGVGGSGGLSWLPFVLLLLVAGAAWWWVRK